jgi:Tfp pilus assembly protein PilF
VLAHQGGRIEEAFHFWEMVWAADPGFPGVRDHLLQEYLTLGMEEFANGNLRAAVERWERATRVAPDDPRARGYLDRAHTQLQQMERISAGR